MLVSEQNVNKNDLKFKEKTEKFENLVMDLHEQYMNLPEKIGKYAHQPIYLICGMYTLLIA